MWRLLGITWISLLLAGCGEKADAVDEFNTREVTLPDGTRIRAEVMTKELDMRRGMMFRDSLPRDRGMLFIHGGVGKYSYWMYQVKVPLDIIWMDSRRNVVEIAENVQPCTTRASECPQIGGTKDALVVLELPAGEARKHGIRVGSSLSF